MTGPAAHQFLPVQDLLPLVIPIRPLPQPSFNRFQCSPCHGTPSSLLRTLSQSLRFSRLMFLFSSTWIPMETLNGTTQCKHPVVCTSNILLRLMQVLILKVPLILDFPRHLVLNLRHSPLACPLWPILSLLRTPPNLRLILISFQPALT